MKVLNRMSINIIYPLLKNVFLNQHSPNVFISLRMNEELKQIEIKTKENPEMRSQVSNQRAAITTGITYGSIHLNNSSI